MRSPFWLVVCCRTAYVYAFYCLGHWFGYCYAALFLTHLYYWFRQNFLPFDWWLERAAPFILLTFAFCRHIPIRITTTPTYGKVRAGRARRACHAAVFYTAFRAIIYYRSACRVFDAPVGGLNGVAFARMATAGGAFPTLLTLLLYAAFLHNATNYHDSLSPPLTTIIICILYILTNSFFSTYYRLPYTIPTLSLPKRAT